MRAALLEMRDEARQVRVEQRLADPVQHRAIDPRELIDDPPELRPGQVMLGLERQKVVVGQRARGAQRVAAVGHLDIDLSRQFGRDGGAGLERYHSIRSVSYQIGMITSIRDVMLSRSEASLGRSKGEIL